MYFFSISIHPWMFFFIFNLDSAWHITDNSVYLSNQQVAWVVALALRECCHA